MTASAPPQRRERPVPGTSELVALIALFIGLNALAINIMLPALDDIGETFALDNPNDRQLVIVVYLFTMGSAQLFYGPLSDRFGRRVVMLVALGGYLAGSALCIVATSFTLLLVARALQGLMTAAARVVAVALVRDLSSGRRMAEIMSIATSIFLLVPAFAPGIGQLILVVAPWRGVFVFLFLYGAVMAGWIYLRIPETLPPERRRPLEPLKIVEAFWRVARTPVTLGYTLASASLFGGFFGFINSSEQIFVDLFGLGARFPLAFGAVALAMTAATILNSRLVGRFGMRRISHLAVMAMAATAVTHALTVVFIGESLASFIGFMAGALFCFGLALPNFNALALEPLGAIAGTASGAFGFMTTTTSAFLGGFIGHAYNGTTMPMALGMMIMCLVGLGVVLATEKGRLFRTGTGAGAAEPPAAPR